MTLTANDLWTMATAALCALACGVAGCYLVLRRMALLGDAISHAVLPGLGVAFLMSGSREPGPMLAGAGAAGLATAGLSALLSRVGRIADDAALGVVFTMMFAAGVLVLSVLPPDLHLDASCVLYGNLELVALDTRVVMGVEVPRAMVPVAVAALVVCGVVWGAFKELRVVAFDPGLARSLGIPAGLVHAGMLALVAGVTVVSFESVGSVLVVAMLIAPGATARLLTDRLGAMYVLSGVLAVVAAVWGYLLAAWLNVTVAGMISVVAGGLFVLAAVAAPRHGMAARAIERTRLSVRIAREDVLGMLYRWHERAGMRGARGVGMKGGDGDEPIKPLSALDLCRAIAPARVTGWALASLRRHGLVVGESGAMRLSETGLREAAKVVSTHRLWEAYLARHLGLPLDHLHEASHRAEHFIGEALKQKVRAEVGDPTVDPHGKPIPGVEGGDRAD